MVVAGLTSVARAFQRDRVRRLCTGLLLRLLRLGGGRFCGFIRLARLAATDEVYRHNQQDRRQLEETLGRVDLILTNGFVEGLYHRDYSRTASSSF